ncbi:MAG: protein-glutamate O-methyltransferase CheR [Gammaproteobacteria bacterium]|nr:protein-glutamate O-methyltransferase CheR [Gammaproteobacteria bacterium]
MTAVEYPVIADEDMPRWESWIEGITGITLEGRKRVLERCIYQRLLGCGVPSLEAYQRLFDHGVEGDMEKAALIDQLTVKDSRFFRNSKAMDAVGDYLLRRARELDGESSEFRIWSVGCALGQETYSLGMLASEQFAFTEVKWQVLGTDISPSAVVYASRGQYTDKQAERVSTHRKTRFFDKVDEDWQVQPHLRDKVSFGASNLKDIDSCPFADQDVIFCQNVLIYFRGDMANHIADELVKRLRPGGLLVLGAGEVSEWDSLAVTRWRSETVNAYRAR